MRPSLFISLIIISLITTSNTFGLIGEWILSTEHLQFASNLNSTNITFTFLQQSNQYGQISNQIIVNTCRMMFYSFSYRQNSIIPVFGKFGSNTRQCQSDQVNQIRRKMQSVFYFSIIDNRLILIYPSKQVAFTLYKNSTMPVGIKGKWDVIEINGKKIQNKQNINVQQDKISLCDGKVILSYKIQTGNRISVKQESNSGDCDDKNEVLKTIKESKFYSRDNEQLRLYNNNVELTLKAIPTAQQKFNPVSKQILHDKWYIHSINGSQLNKQTQAIYYYYFLIITPERFRFYGGCNVEFSFYDFINGYEVNQRDVVYVKKPSCRYVNQDTVVLNSLFVNGKFVSYNQTTGILSFFNSNKQNIMEFTTIMPQTRDIMPSANI